MSERAKEFEKILSLMLDGKGNANPNVVYFLLPDEWRTLASKPDKTDEDKTILNEQYKIALTEFASEYLTYIASVMNSNAIDGCISKDVFMNFLVEKKKKQLADKSMIDVSQLSAGFVQKIINEVSIIARRLLRGKDKEFIDKRDYAAYLYALDWSSEGPNKNKLNGIIEARNYSLTNALIVEDTEENLIDLKLKYGYKNLFGG